jgi:hypothetical protein
MKEAINLNAEVRRGQEAKRLLESELFLDVRKKFTERTFQAFKKASADDAESLRKIKVLDMLTTQFFAELEQCVKTGQLAAIQIDEMKRKQNRR